MRALGLGLVFGVAFGFVTTTIGVRADEEKISPDKLPAAVLEAVKKRFPEAVVKGADKETEGGKISYEVTIKDKGQSIDVLVTAEGVITELEKLMEFKDLPKVVADTLQEKYPGATYKKIEEVTKVNDGEEKLAYYEIVVVTADKKKAEVHITPDGKVKEEEKK